MKGVVLAIVGGFLVVGVVLTLKSVYTIAHGMLFMMMSVIAAAYFWDMYCSRERK